jgi:hypothetical protein
MIQLQNCKRLMAPARVCSGDASRLPPQNTRAAAKPISRELNRDRTMETRGARRRNRGREEQLQRGGRVPRKMCRKPRPRRNRHRRSTPIRRCPQERAARWGNLPMGQPGWDDPGPEASRSWRSRPAPGGTAARFGGCAGRDRCRERRHGCRRRCHDRARDGRRPGRCEARRIGFVDARKLRTGRICGSARGSAGRSGELLGDLADSSGDLARGVIDEFSYGGGDTAGGSRPQNVADNRNRCQNRVDDVRDGLDDV